MGKQVVFSVYRYQLLPISNNFQLSLYSEYKSIDELIKNKNQVFHKVITDESVRYFGKGNEIISKLEAANEDVYFFRMGVKKTVNIHDENFKQGTVFNYPNSLVYINNDPEKQFLLIEHEPEAFYDPKALKNAIEKSLNKYLQGFGLSVYIRKVTNVTDFWETMLHYKGRIKSLRFNFVRPNMSNISSKAVQALKLLKNNSNSHKTNLELNAPENGVLENLTPENTEIAGLADYNAKGGGTSTIKIKGQRKRIKTSKKEVEVKIDEIIIEDVPYNKVSDVIESHLKALNE
jgi:hypothetical protein